MHSFRQQLIDKAQHAANTAATAATAVANPETHQDQEASVDKSNAHPAAPHSISSRARESPAYVPSAAAAAAVSAFAAPSADPTPDTVSSPFASSDAAISPFLPVGGVERQGRRRDISGSLPLEQMFSRLPSPVGSATGHDQASSDGAASQPSSRHISRLGSSLDLTQIVHQAPTRPTPATDSATDRISGQRSQERWSSDSFGQHMAGRCASRLGSNDSFKDELAFAHSQLPATTPAPNHQPHGSGENQTDDVAAIAGSPGQAEASEPLRTVYSGEGLLFAPQSVGQYSSQLTPDTASPSLSHEGELASRLSLATQKQPSPVAAWRARQVHAAAVADLHYIE